MEGAGSGDSGSEYFDCATDRSRSSSEEAEDRAQQAKKEVQRAPTIRRFRRIDNNNNNNNSSRRRKAKKEESEKSMGDHGIAICGYELRADSNTHALRRLSMDAALERDEFLRKAQPKAESMRSKVQDEVMKVLFGPSDSKTPDEEKYEIVEEEEVVRGRGRTGTLFRFSMWATLGFITLVLGGRRAKVGCSEFYPSVRERDPVPKVIVRKQI